MAQLTMPNVGEGVTEGTVTRWLKREGDTVALDEPIVEVETDKAVVEIPSPFAGTLSKILVQEGEVVPIGTPLAEFAGEAAAESAPSVVERRQVEREPAAAAPVAEPARAKVAPVALGRSNGSGEHRVRQYSPVVLKLAAENDVDLSLVRGTGIDGRVTRKDLVRYIENPAANTAPASPTAGVVGVDSGGSRPSAKPAPGESASRAEPPASPDQPPDGRDRVVPITPTRRTIAQRMSEAHATIPVAWMVVEADVTELVALRERTKADFERTEGVKLTYMPFFVQAIVSALKLHPEVNSSLGADGIVVHGRFDMGIAVATERGLVVPVIRAAGDKSVAGLARELDQLGRKARDRKLTVDDMRDATLTIDNTGAFGSIMSQPIVPVGQAAIITTEAIRRELRVLDDGAFASRSVVNLCISFDHRILDGAEVGAFMQDVRARLEGIRTEQDVY